MTDFTITWDKLLSERRIPAPTQWQTNTSGRDDRSPFEADYDRVVFSEPFRRLAKKTQVHPLAKNDHVHNRLTHSIEVASVGRTFGTLVAAMPDVQTALGERARHIPMIMQVACLIHDIGNPPFGHAGEEAIREWVTTNETTLFKVGDGAALQVHENIKRDFKSFEGNAQGFRFAARSDNAFTGYMRLTFASVGSSVKYPWASSDLKPGQKVKFSYFHSEREIFDSAWRELGLINHEGKAVRHPLSFLVEAADDICYRMLDMEDAALMGVCDAQRVRNIFAQISGKSNKTDEPLSRMRGSAIRVLIEEIWKLFQGSYQDILNGKRTKELKADLTGSGQEGLVLVKKLYDEIFVQRTKVAYELGAYNVLGKIIATLARSARDLSAKHDYEATNFVSKRCLDLTWGGEHCRKNEKQPYEWWVSQIIDFIAGLTDNYAIRLANEIESGQHV